MKLTEIKVPTWWKNLTVSTKYSTNGLVIDLELKQKYDPDPEDPYVGGYVIAKLDGKEIGRMPYGFGEKPIPQIGDMEIDRKYQRMGIGTEMVHFVRKQGIPLQHYPDKSAMSKAGAAFATKVN